LWHAVSRPRMTMREFSDAFLDAYIAAEGKNILGSVGAYRLEGRGAQLFELIEGDNFAILGLPLLELLGFLRNTGAILS
jgi:septum formation protein